MREFFSFPNPVNEKAARTVAFVVMLLCGVALATSAYWLFLPLAYGFTARVLSGPRLSPLGRLASAVVAPRLGAPKPVPGPPKRFAQAIGATLTTAGAVGAFALGAHAAGDALFATVIVAAALESIVGLCLGCELFALLIRVGLVPERMCSECVDISMHLHRAPSRRARRALDWPPTGNKRMQARGVMPRQSRRGADARASLLNREGKEIDNGATGTARRRGS